MAKKSTSNRKRLVKVEAVGQAHVHSSFNNIIISITNQTGQVISWSSAGKMGFKGSKKNTPYAAQMAATDCAKVAFDLKRLEELDPEGMKRFYKDHPELEEQSQVPKKKKRNQMER